MRRTVGPPTAVTLGLLGVVSFSLLVSAPAFAAPKPDPLPVPKPQPKTPPPPPPRQPAPPPPPAFQPPPPPPAVSPQPSAAELATAARERAAAFAAQRRAAKIATARWRAAKRRAAEARADSTRLQKLLSGEATGTKENPSEPLAKLWPASASSSSRGPVIPFVAGLGALALLLLIIALVPARAAPWYWAERMLAARQQQFALTGLIGVFSVAVAFAVVFLTG